MAIDTTGMNEGGNTEARAGDMANLDDKALFEELNLAELTSGGSNTANADDDSLQGAAEDEETSDEAAEGESGSEAETPDDGRSGEEEEGETEGSESESAEGETRRLAAEFTLRQGDEEVEIPSDVTIEFTAEGEVRSLPLDKVVRLAQMGYYNEQRTEEIREFREALPEIEANFDALQRQVQEYEEFARRVLSGDEDYLEAERDAFAAAQSPEARARRAEQELERVRRGQEGSQVEQQARQFVAGLTPSFEAILAESPEVTFEEVIGRFNMLTAPLMVRGQIPPKNFREVERIVRGDLRAWAEAQNTKRSSTKRTQTQRVDRARAETHAAKRQVARAVLPRGTQTGGAQQQAPKKYERASDVADDLANIVSESLNPRRT